MILNLDLGIELSINTISFRVYQRINCRVEFHLLYLQDMNVQAFQIVETSIHNRTALSVFTEAEGSFEGNSSLINDKSV